MKSVIYTRVSTTEQVDGYSLTYQEELCKEYCKKQGWEAITVFQERGESAKSADRTQLLELLKYCSKNKGIIDIVLVHKLDRIARNSADHHSIRGILTKSNIVLRSVSEPIDESPQGKFMEGIYASVAQLDNDVRAERTKEGLKEKVKQGFWAWKAPNGYRNTSAGLVIDPEKAPLIKKAFETYAQGGYSLIRMAKKMNQWGLRSIRGNRMTPQSVDHIFQNKLYIGIIVVKNWPGETVGIHQKIINTDLFYRVQAIREGKSYTAVTHFHNNPEFSLKNIAKCDTCGKNLTGSWSKGRKNKYAYYHCTCGKTRIPKKQFEELYYESLKSIKPNHAFIKLFRIVLVDVWKGKQSDVIFNLSKVTNEIEKLRTTKQRLIQKYLDGNIKDEEYKSFQDHLDSDIAVKELERSEFRSEEINIDYLVNLSENLFNNVATIWLDAPFEHKLLFQSLLFPKGIVYKDGNIRTEALGLPFNLIEDSATSKTNLVPQMILHWNQLLSNLRAWSNLLTPDLKSHTSYALT